MVTKNIADDLRRKVIEALRRKQAAEKSGEIVEPPMKESPWETMKRKTQEELLRRLEEKKSGDNTQLPPDTPSSPCQFPTWMILITSTIMLVLLWL